MTTLHPITTKIGVLGLTLLITSGIDSIRNLPATALFGTTLIFFFIFSAIVFLIPAALVSAELTSQHTEKGGIFAWVRMALGEKMGFLAIWLQWINTMIWYPTILSFIAATATFLFDPALAENKIYLVSVILGVFWLMTILNLRGLPVSTKIAGLCGVFGMALPMLLIILLAAIWVLTGQPLNIHFTASNLLPSFSHTNSWISLTAIMTAFLGMELATVHVNQVRHPQQNFPKALYYSVIFILLTMIAGSLAIAIVLPLNQINLVEGVMQAFTAFLQAYHLSFLTPLLALMILFGSLGGMINWIISPAKGLLQAAEQGFLPAFFKKQNQHHVAANLLMTQAVLVSLLCLTFLLMPSVNGSYWLLTALSTQLYMVMYVLMFVAALILKHRSSRQKASGFVIPGGKLGGWIACLLGLFGSCLTIVVDFFPPDGINVGSFWHYETLFTLGMLLMTAPVLLGLGYHRLRFVRDSV